MLSSEARIETQAASKYLQQLCKHWSHKFAVEFTPEQGRIPFPDGRSCELAAADAALTIRVTAADPATLDRTKIVVIDHLKRFAFRENLDDIGWKDLGATD
jgi:uncharacterized protein